MRLAAVVVHFRTPDMLAACLPPLHGFDEVVLVDNASGDGTPQRVRDEHPWVNVIEAAKNGGFGAGANLGVQATNSEAVVLLNPDSVATSGLRNATEGALDAHPGMSVGGCRLDALDGSAQVNGRRWYTPWSVVARRLSPRSRAARRHGIDGWDRRADRPVDWVAGNGMVVRRAAFLDLGGFDERYFMYFEDVDLCLRAWRAGGEVWYLSGAHVVHDERRASARGVNRALGWHLRAYGRFLAKWRVSGLRPPDYGDRLARSILPEP